MMVQTRQRRRREFTGPTPNSVAVVARPPNKRPPDYLILENIKKAEQKRQMDEITRMGKLTDLKSNWERETDNKIQLNTIKRRVNNMMQANRFNLEDRRERLRELLGHEEQAYLQEMADSEETTLERQAKMRDRARLLKEKREAERLAFVQEKYEQQFRNQCEELRSTSAKRQQDVVTAERMEQLQMKAAKEAAAKREDEVFTKLWYADIEAKRQREEEDARRMMQGNVELAEGLQQQMAALEEQKNEQKELILEEARLLDEQKTLRRIEETAALVEKHRKQSEVRDMYTRSLELKKQREAKKMQEELAFDLKILEQLLEESKNEAMELAQRKKELREEDRRYREYLAKLREQEKLHEAEVERLVNEEVEKTWDKRIKQWRLERQARKQLLQEVVAYRKQQIEEKLRRNILRQDEGRREQQDLLDKIAENKRYERDQADKLRATNKAYERDLRDQLEYNARLREEDKEEEIRMWKKQQEAEIEYRAKLEELRGKPDLSRMHPMRQMMYSRSAVL